jgi:hypothetical protein
MAKVDNAIARIKKIDSAIKWMKVSRSKKTEIDNKMAKAGADFQNRFAKALETAINNGKVTKKDIDKLQKQLLSLK